MVIAALVILAALVLPLTTSILDDSHTTSTRSTLVAVRGAIVGDGRGGYMREVGGLPTTLADLFELPPGVASYDRYSHRGWNGPYLVPQGFVYKIDAAHGFTDDYGADGDPAVVDAWQHPMILQYPNVALNNDQRRQYARLISAGPDGVINTPADVLNPSAAERGDDLVMFLLRSDDGGTP